MLVERRDDPVESKVCSKCNTCKQNSEFYRDSSKPDGLQVSSSGNTIPSCLGMLFIDPI